MYMKKIKQEKLCVYVQSFHPSMIKNIQANSHSRAERVNVYKVKIIHEKKSSSTKSA